MAAQAGFSAASSTDNWQALAMHQVWQKSGGSMQEIVPVRSPHRRVICVGVFPQPESVAKTYIAGWSSHTTLPLAVSA